MIAMEVIIVKIKAVSELTGLTTRTIRVYIDEQLIAPEFTENYLGRRSFEFSQSDIAALQNIATLRKYGFSIGNKADGNAGVSENHFLNHIGNQALFIRGLFQKFPSNREIKKQIAHYDGGAFGNARFGNGNKN